MCSGCASDRACAPEVEPLCEFPNVLDFRRVPQEQQREFPKGTGPDILFSSGPFRRPLGWDSCLDYVTGSEVMGVQHKGTQLWLHSGEKKKTRFQNDATPFCDVNVDALVFTLELTETERELYFFSEADIQTCKFLKKDNIQWTVASFQAKFAPYKVDWDGFRDRILQYFGYPSGMSLLELHQIAPPVPICPKIYDGWPLAEGRGRDGAYIMWATVNFRKMDDGRHAAQLWGQFHNCRGCQDRPSCEWLEGQSRRWPETGARVKASEHEDFCWQCEPGPEMHMRVCLVCRVHYGFGNILPHVDLQLRDRFPGVYERLPRRCVEIVDMEDAAERAAACAALLPRLVEFCRLDAADTGQIPGTNYY